MLKKILQRLYFIERRILQIDQKVLLAFMLERYRKDELEIGVIFEEMTIQWREELHRFAPINFTLELEDLQFQKFEEDMYYLVIEDASLGDYLLTYYDAQLDEEIQTIPYQEEQWQRQINYLYA